jgi:hypothetical protein
MATRLAFLILMGVMCLGLGFQRAEAARAWCRADPVIMVDGQLADVFVSSDLAMLTSARGPIQLVIAIPKGSRGSVALTDVGFGHGYNISFVESSGLTRSATHTQVRVSAYVSATSSSHPVDVNFSPRALNAGLRSILFGVTASGTANAWVTVTTR